MRSTVPNDAERRQQLSDHAIPLGDAGGIDEDDILRLHVEALGEQHARRVARVEVENLGIVPVRSTNNVDTARVRRVLVHAPDLTDSCGQGQVAVDDLDRARASVPRP